MLRLHYLRLAVALTWLLTGCQGAAPEAPTAIAPPAMVDLMAEARTAMTSGEFARSAELLRRVLGADATNLEAHYRLAVSASHLDQADEARREFEWVVANGRPDAPEVRIARDWLRRAVSTPTAAPGNTQAEQNPALAGLAGTAVGAADGVPRPMRRMQLFLKGIRGTPVQDEAQSLRTGQDGTYRFTGMKPGEYMLTDRVAGPALWRLKVTLRRGQTERLDLSMDNSIDRRNDFPDYR